MIPSNKDNGENFDTDFDDLNDLPDFDDSNEDGIFAPEPQKKKSSAKTNLMAGVAAIAVAGVAGYMLFMNPQSPPEMPVSPPAQVATVTPPPAETPAAAPVAPATAEIPAQTPPVDTPTPQTPVTDSATTAITNESVTEQTTAVTDPAAPITPPASLEAPKTEDAVVTPEVPAPVVEQPAVAPEKLEEDAVKPEQAADQVPTEPAIDANKTAQIQPVPPEIPTETAKAESSEQITPPDQSALKETPEPKTETTDVLDETLSSPAPAPVTTPEIKEQAKKEDTKLAQADVKEEKTTDKAFAPEKKEEKKSASEEKSKTVKKEDEKVTYFDSPFGSSLKDIPPPSINPNLAPGESVIIVQKDTPPPTGMVFEKGNDTPRLESQLVAGGRALKLGRYDAALEIYNRLYQMNPRDSRILMGRALTLQKMGEVAAAISGYEELLRIDPNNVDATVNLMGLVRKEYPAVALEKLLDLRQRYPTSAAISAQLGVAYADSGNVESGLRYLNMAAQMQPENPVHMYNMAVIADRAGQRKRAVSFYEKALEIDAVYGTGRAFSRDTVYDRLARLRGN